MKPPALCRAPSQPVLSEFLQEILQGPPCLPAYLPSPILALRGQLGNPNSAHGFPRRQWRGPSWLEAWREVVTGTEVMQDHLSSWSPTRCFQRSRRPLPHPSCWATKTLFVPLSFPSPEPLPGAKLPLLPRNHCSVRAAFPDPRTLSSLPSPFSVEGASGYFIFPSAPWAWPEDKQAPVGDPGRNLALQQLEGKH